MDAAVIAAAGGFLTGAGAFVASVLGNRKSAATHKIVQGNGAGTVTEIGEQVLAYIKLHGVVHAVQDERLNHLERRCLGGRASE